MSPLKKKTIDSKEGELYIDVGILRNYFLAFNSAAGAEYGIL